MKRYKYQSKIDRSWIPLKPTDVISELKRFKYKIVEISENEYKELLKQEQ